MVVGPQLGTAIASSGDEQVGDRTTRVSGWHLAAGEISIHPCQAAEDLAHHTDPQRVGQILNCSAKAVNALVDRAKQTLRGALAEEEER